MAIRTTNEKRRGGRGVVAARSVLLSDRDEVRGI